MGKKPRQTEEAARRWAGSLRRIHFEDRPAGSPEPDIRHEEFMAMADAFLGEGYDPSKLALCESAQIEMQGELQALAARGQEAGEPALDELARLSEAFMAKCSAILGAQDFAKLFGGSEQECAEDFRRDLAAGASADGQAPRA